MGWRWGKPLPGVDRQTDACENITSRHTTYAGGKNRILKYIHVHVDHSEPEGIPLFYRCLSAVTEYLPKQLTITVVVCTVPGVPLG